MLFNTPNKTKQKADAGTGIHFSPTYLPVPGTGLHAWSIFNTSSSYLIFPFSPEGTHQGILSKGLCQSPPGGYDNILFDP